LGNAGIGWSEGDWGSLVATISVRLTATGVRSIRVTYKGDAAFLPVTSIAVAKNLGVAKRADVQAIVDDANAKTAVLRNKVIGNQQFDIRRDRPDSASRRWATSPPTRCG